MLKFETVGGVRKFVEGGDVGVTRRRVTVTEAVSGLVLDCEEFEGGGKYALCLYPVEQVEVNGKPNPLSHADYAEGARDQVKRKVTEVFVLRHFVKKDGQTRLQIKVTAKG